MVEFRAENPADDMKIEMFEGFGEIAVGGTSSNWYILMVAQCLDNQPLSNKFLLANKLKLVDRITKTRIFPRVGMALPDGEVYEEPEKEEVLILPDTDTEN